MNFRARLELLCHTPAERDQKLESSGSCAHGSADPPARHDGGGEP
jgi:hypothetical protein